MPAAARIRCGVGPDVCAGSQMGTTRDGRGDVAHIVSGTRLWDTRCCGWTTAMKQRMVI